MVIFVTYKDDNSSFLSILQFPIGSFIVKNNNIVGILYRMSVLMERSFIQPYVRNEDSLQNTLGKTSNLQKSGKFNFNQFLIGFYN